MWVFSLTHWLLRSIRFHFNVFFNFPNVFLLLIFNFIPLWWENVSCLISIVSRLPRRLVTWSTPEMLRALRNTVAGPSLHWVCRVAHVLCFLLICCLVALSVIENRLLKVDSPQWLLLNCPFHPSSVWFASRIVGLYCEMHILYNGYIFLMDSPAIIIKRPSLSLVTIFVLKPLLPHMVESLSLLFTVWFIWFILLWVGSESSQIQTALQVGVFREITGQVK